MSDARLAEDRSSSERRLEAFHRTFSFCLECGQYACPSCWNSDQGRCLSCAPDPRSDRPPAAELTPAGPDLVAHERDATPERFDHERMDAEGREAVRRRTRRVEAEQLVQGRIRHNREQRRLEPERAERERIAPDATPPAEQGGWPPYGPVYRPPPGRAYSSGDSPRSSVPAGRQRRGPAWPLAQLPASEGGAGPGTGTAQVWDTSARSVGPSGAGVRPCVNCDLTLSANARFCRRCGTRQG